MNVDLTARNVLIRPEAGPNVRVMIGGIYTVEEACEIVKQLQLAILYGAITSPAQPLPHEKGGG